ncbi:MAG: glutamate racemase [Legionella sp. 21-45-4]|nr:MAG: glutamate racemase [Legionella sp. 21-45-4]
MNKAAMAIGVFDSGMGGMTVLRALKAALPHESFIYLGDTARLPYGTKSPETVQQYAVQMARVLVERRIKALVIACNTATTAALPHLQNVLPDIPVLGVVAPGARAAVASTQNQRIAVLATETTIAANAYQDLIQHYLPRAQLYARACSVLVALAEEGMVDNAIAEAAIHHYLSGLQEEDTVLLGCTHFPVFKPLIMRLYPHLRLVDSAEAIANELKQTLNDTQLLASNRSAAPRVQYLVTDSVKRFHKVGELFLGHALDLNAIELIDIRPIKH